MEDGPDSNIVRFPTNPEDKGKNFRKLKEEEKIKELRWLQEMIFRILAMGDLDDMTAEEIDTLFNPEKIKELRLELTPDILDQAIAGLQKLKERLKLRE